MSHAQYTWSSFDGFHLEPELELFEIWEVMVRQIIIIVILIVLNFKHMGTLVQVQLYTFSYSKALFSPQKLPKIADKN